jgi:charged multivesicular body protein 4
MSFLAPYIAAHIVNNWIPDYTFGMFAGTPSTVKSLTSKYLIPIGSTIGYYSITTIGSGFNYLYSFTKTKGLEYQHTNFDDYTDPQSKSENAKDAIMRIKESIDLIENKKEVIDTKINTCLEEAITKKNSGNKKGAIFALRRKKLYEKELETLESILNNLLLKVMNLETMVINLEVYSTLKLAACQMKTINNEIDVDQIDLTIDDIQEGLNLTEEINSILSQPIVNSEYDDSELLEELDSLDSSTIVENKIANSISEFDFTKKDYWPEPPNDNINSVDNYYELPTI